MQSSRPASLEPRRLPLARPVPAVGAKLDLAPAHQAVLAELAQALAGPPCISTLICHPGVASGVLVTRAAEGWRGPVRRLRASSMTLLSTLSALSGDVTGPSPASARGRNPALLVVEDAHELPLGMLAPVLNLYAGGNPPHLVLVGTAALWVRLREPGFSALLPHVRNRLVLFPAPRVSCPTTPVARIASYSNGQSNCKSITFSFVRRPGAARASVMPDSGRRHRLAGGVLALLTIVLAGAMLLAGDSLAPLSARLVAETPDNKGEAFNFEPTGRSLPHHFSVSRSSDRSHTR